MHGTFWILCPLANTKGTIPVAATALAAACLFCLMLTLLCHRLQVLMGWAILPFLHIFPKAACPLLCVPLPPTLGILATALPVPQDSALCCMPALALTACAYLLFLAKFEWTKWTISFLIGTEKTVGRGIALPTVWWALSALNTEMVGTDVIEIQIRFEINDEQSGFQ